MRPMGKSSESKTRKVTPPSPAYMSNDQFANYLAELRSNRIARPGGARPQPAGARPPPVRSMTSRTSTGRFSPDASSQTESHPGLERTPSHVPSIAAGSVASRYSSVSGRSRDYYPTGSSSSVPLKPSEVVPSATYIERGQRWMEKEEANSLRDAMEELDLRKRPKEAPKDTPTDAPDDDTRIYEAALDEAAELVWKHQNGESPPRPSGPYRYRPHLRKNSYAHARTASVNSHGGSRSVSGSSTDSDTNSRRERPSIDGSIHSNPRSKSYGSVGRKGPFSEKRRSSVKRNISGEVDRPFSGDQIWEEPESSPGKGVRTSGRTSPEKLSNKPANPMNRVHFEPLHEEATTPKPANKIEIHRNPPTRSRNPLYTANPATPPRVDEKVEKKNGMEVRANDIREATSMRLRDRSPKLPEPTAVSDSPGRPIVSFDANWKAPDESTDASPERSTPTPTHSRPSYQSSTQPMDIPSIVVAEESAPMSRPSPSANVPFIAVAAPDERPRDLPTINVPTIAVDEAPSDVNIPVIVTPDDEQPSNNSHTRSNPRPKDARPLPTPGARGAPRQLPQPRGHWSPSPSAAGRVTATCHECGFPIEGRFVALAGGTERFHPQCFSCYSCGTSLEAMEISPEPDHIRQERINRIRRRAAGEMLAEEPGMTMAEDGDERLRFFCHLDWHELYAPKCKHCKTSILGEHIVALGSHWHYGHFFCAECGDPFEHGMTHIEKDGYAWCIKCQTKRTERRAPKCKKCRTAVIGQYIQALGGEWHEHCFRCAECEGGFDDGQIFPKEMAGGTIVLCTGCRMKELKA
ncbi:Fc.00g069560.m01.CDS01 [Cosmosporella sp. VM-42]